MKINLLKAGGDPGPCGTGAYDVAYPDRLEARIGGYPGPCFAITWDGDCLIWTGRGQEFPEQRKVCRPRASSWERFWDLLDETGAWDWPEDCGCLGMDGTTWSVEIAHGGRDLAPVCRTSWLSMPARLRRQASWGSAPCPRGFSLHGHPDGGVPVAGIL